MIPGLEGFLSDAPLWGVGVALVVALVLTRELGGFAHRRLDPDFDPSQISDEGLIVTGVLGLLALLVAFTFSLALSRFEQRREMVIQEANAIGTAYERVQLLDMPERAALSVRLKAYAKARLELGEASGAARGGALERSETLLAPLWRETAEALRPIRTTPLASLIASSVNSVLDLATERKASLEAHLPGPVLQALILSALGASGVVGYALPRMGGGHRAASLLMFLLLALAIVLILDLDRPRSGSIRVPQEAMRATVASLDALTAPAP